MNKSFLNGKIFIGAILFCAMIVSAFTQAEAQRYKNLYNVFCYNKEVKVYIDEIKNSSGVKSVNTQKIKEVLENDLLTRMTLNFKLAAKEEADIIINCDVLEYRTESGDPEGGPFGIVPKERLTQIHAIFSVTDAKKGKLLWSDRIKALLSGEGASEAEREAMLYERLAKIFLRECFSEAQSKKRNVSVS
ncbi:MAG: hypothetical protein PHW46_06475 [Candidatus Omnitrophica bacterium]|nr:hypothetical protein [Candidatus Omnitrophota bacterium]